METILQFIKCKCGCNENIKIQPHHKYYGIPDFIHGHQNIGRIKKMPANFSEIRRKAQNKLWENPEYRQHMSEVHKDSMQNYQTGIGVYRKYAYRILNKICNKCKTIKPKRFEIHHKDENRYNNPLDGSNWEILCTHCHRMYHIKNRIGMKYEKHS
ncbi:MAG: HNH endonuclease [Nanoarchaeota archaeon]